MLCMFSHGYIQDLRFPDKDTIDGYGNEKWKGNGPVNFVKGVFIANCKGENSEIVTGLVLRFGNNGRSIRPCNLYCRFNLFIGSRLTRSLVEKCNLICNLSVDRHQ